MAWSRRAPRYNNHSQHVANVMWLVMPSQTFQVGRSNFWRSCSAFTYSQSQWANWTPLIARLAQDRGRPSRSDLEGHGRPAMVRSTQAEFERQQRRTKKVDVSKMNDPIIHKVHWRHWTEHKNYAATLEVFRPRTKSENKTRNLKILPTVSDGQIQSWFKSNIMIRFEE